MTKITPEQLPLSAELFRELAENDSSVSAEIPVDFSTIIDSDIDALNDYVSEKITGSCVGLQDIGYEVIHAAREGSTQTVYLLVSGVLNDDILESD